ncbi:hypothetical protein E2562_005999 [Oryza meyeriana var. granulata]|uniref:Uncharacterized protein n=1 Tax=Oryza meyeriana var. granulata TaxID=110450 RepID=A0A6G1EV65_9ORYZ|nr:hypothetical protein E2562_005999 [Oryza meyeriana var. granulata]
MRQDAALSSLGSGAGGEVRQVAGRVAGVDNDRPPVRQGEHERSEPTARRAAALSRGAGSRSRGFSGTAPRHDRQTERNRVQPVNAIISPGRSIQLDSPLLSSIVS